MQSNQVSPYKTISIPLPEFFDLNLIMDSDQSPALECFWSREQDGAYTRKYRSQSQSCKIIAQNSNDALSVTLIPEMGNSISDSDIYVISRIIHHQFALDIDYSLIFRN